MITMAKSPTVKKIFKNSEGKDIKITCELMSAEDSWEHYTVILDILAPMMGSYVDESSKDELSSMYHKPSFWKDSLTAISSKLKDPTVKHTVTELLETCQCQGEICGMGWEEYRGNLGLMFEVLMWVVQENFGDSLDMGKLGLTQLISSKQE